MKQDYDIYPEDETYYDDDSRQQWRQVRLSPSDAVMEVLRRYGETDGRSSRSEFWWWVVFVAVVSPALNFLSRMLELPALWVAVLFLLAIPTVCVSQRRLHDSGLSSWWLLLIFTGLGIPVVLWMLLQPSERGGNEWGDQPNMLRND